VARLRGVPSRIPQSHSFKPARHERMFNMSRMTRALLLAMLVSAILSSSGCIHTWTGTYAEYPDSAYDTPHVHVQGDPHDG
jgi:hypothetical protein